MQWASSDMRTCRAFASASEKTATGAIPRSRQARITRTAISPRLAIRIFLNIDWSLKFVLGTLCFVLVLRMSQSRRTKYTVPSSKHELKPQVSSRDVADRSGAELWRREDSCVCGRFARRPDAETIDNRRRR